MPDRCHKKPASRLLGVVKVDLSMIQIDARRKPLTCQGAINIKHTIDENVPQLLPQFDSIVFLGTISKASRAVVAEEKLAVRLIEVV